MLKTNSAMFSDASSDSSPATRLSTGASAAATSPARTPAPTTLSGPVGVALLSGDERDARLPHLHGQLPDDRRDGADVLGHGLRRRPERLALVGDLWTDAGEADLLGLRGAVRVDDGLAELVGHRPGDGRRRQRQAVRDAVAEHDHQELLPGGLPDDGRGLGEGVRPRCRRPTRSRRRAGSRPRPRARWGRMPRTPCDPRPTGSRTR